MVGALLAGAAGTIVPGDEFDTRISYEDVDTGGAFMVFGPERDLLDMVRNFMHFFAHESCGFCTPCRVGGTLLKNLVDKVLDGAVEPIMHFLIEEKKPNTLTFIASAP